MGAPDVGGRRGRARRLAAGRRRVRARGLGGCRRPSAQAFDRAGLREELLGLVAADAAHDLELARQPAVLGQLERPAGGAVDDVGDGEDEASTSQASSAPTHIGQGSRVTKIVASARRLATRAFGRPRAGRRSRRGPWGRWFPGPCRGPGRPSRRSRPRRRRSAPCPGRAPSEPRPEPLP
jgi:hypothetical protein